MCISSWIENLTLDNRIEMDKEKQKKDEMIVYEYLMLQHAALKCILDKKEDILMKLSTVLRN